jgi:hypothetical protein
MKLVAHVPQGEPWPLREEGDSITPTLAQAISEVADQTAADAGCDLLDSPDEIARDELRDRIIAEMSAHLNEVGDHYRAPDGVLYTLEESDE